MPENPFEPPQHVEPARVQSAVRKRSSGAFRAALLILAVPAIFNYLEFDAKYLMGYGIPSPTVFVMRTTNIVAMLCLLSALWFAGVIVLERIALALQGLFARQVDREQWLDPLYVAINRLAILAIPGAALWMIWVFAFYRSFVNPLVLSLTLGTLANLLGAMVYLPLLYQWYVMARR